MLDPELEGFIAGSEKDVPMEIKRFTAACMGLWVDPFAVQGTFKRLLHHHNSKPSILRCSAFFMDFPGGSDGKASVYNAGDLGSSPGLGRSPGEGNGNPLQYWCLENPMDRGA